MCGREGESVWHIYKECCVFQLTEPLTICCIHAVQFSKTVRRRRKKNAQNKTKQNAATITNNNSGATANEKKNRQKSV